MLADFWRMAMTNLMLVMKFGYRLTNQRLLTKLLHTFFYLHELGVPLSSLSLQPVIRPYNCTHYLRSTV